MPWWFEMYTWQSIYTWLFFVPWCTVWGSLQAQFVTRENWYRARTWLTEEGFNDAPDLWETCGIPNSGIVYDLQWDSKYECIMWTSDWTHAAEFKDMEWDKISLLYFAKDMNKFRKKWNDQFSKLKHSTHYRWKGKWPRYWCVFSSNFSHVCFESVRNVKANLIY